MRISDIALVIFVFLLAAGYFGWFATSAFILGLVAIIFMITRVLEMVNVLPPVDAPRRERTV